MEKKATKMPQIISFADIRPNRNIPEIISHKPRIEFPRSGQVEVGSDLYSKTEREKTEISKPTAKSIQCASVAE